MKIIFIGGRDIHTLGGIESYMYNLATHLTQMGHVPIVYCESDRNQVEYVNGFKVIHHKSFASNLICKPILGLKSTLHAIWTERHISLIHYNAWPASLWCLIPRILGIPSLLEGHGLEWKRSKYSPKAQKVMKFMEKFTAHLNNHLIMVSQEQTDYFLQEYGKRCVTIPTAVELPLNVPSVNILSKFQLEKEKYYLFLGRLVQDKNPDYLIKAFIASGIKNKKLVIAGANDAMPEYVNYLKNLAQGYDNIIFTGAVYGEDKEALLQYCYTFCIPSTIEGLAITLLEAMSYERMVLASDIKANREGLGDNGIWVKYEDEKDLTVKLSFCENHQELSAIQGRMNRKRIEENFTWDIVARRYEEYVKTIVNKNI